jgi:hypothetical protein
VAVVAVVAIAADRYVWPVAVIPGLIFCVLGTRMAYGHRGADAYLRHRSLAPWWGVGTSLNAHRQIEGAVVCVIGVFLLCFAGAGVASIL